VSLSVIDTDSLLIREDVQSHFPEVRLIKRPEHLRSDTTPMNDVLLYDVGKIDAEFFLQTHSTNPLLNPETVNRAIELFFKHYPHNDSLFSVTKMQTRLWDAKGRPMNHDPGVLIRTQDLVPVFIENSCLYIFSKHMLCKRRNRIGKRPYLFEIDPIESYDIDEEHDFILAEKLFETLTPQE
jgi:CMP-N-acetylneuraminic acid synthetase